MVRVLKPQTGRMVVLVKPQFEVGKGKVGKGGIVRDPALHEEVCDKVRKLRRSAGFRTDIMESPITGAEGNKEFLFMDAVKPSWTSSPNRIRTRGR